jgi:DNA-binding CsgD family transcriptional regulator
MITYDPTDAEARFLYQKAGFAAYCAYRRLELEPDQNFEDAKQEAAVTFWDAYRRKGNERYAFVAARNAALQSLMRHKNPYALSLDAPHDDGDNPWLERLVVDSADDGWDESDWLSDADLRSVVTEMFTMPASRQALDDYRRLLRLQMAGHTLRETAKALGKTYDATKALRRRLILKLADHYGIAPVWEEVVPKLERDDDFEGVVRAIGDTPPPTGTIEYNVAVLRLLIKGYDTAAIAVELGRTEDGIKGARRDLKRHLEAYCRSLGIEPPVYQRNGGGWRPAHHYARMGAR